jgi:hypothetical protein
MAILRFFNPIVALRDLRSFLSMRQKHELVFGFLAIGVTFTLVTLFFLDSHDLKRPWKRDVYYVQSWPIDRSLAQIRAQQKIDMAQKKKDDAKLEAMQKERQAEFKKVDDVLNRWGI